MKKHKLQSFAVIVGIVLMVVLNLAHWDESTKPNAQNRTIGSIFNRTDSEWIQDIPVLSVGDYLNNPIEEKEKHKVYILSVADPNCTDCWTSETMLFRLSELLSNNTIHYKNKTIPIFRLDSTRHQEIVESENLNLNRVPKTFMYFKGDYYPFEEIDDTKLFLNFINRVFVPVITLKTKKDIEKFKSSFDEGYPKSTRIIAFITSKSEYKDELQFLTASTRALSHREDLRVAKIVNARIVKDTKKSHKTWFSDVSSNSIVSFTK